MEPSAGQREQQAEIMQAHIAQVAMALFAEHGFTATSTRKVAIAAGVSEGLIFHHFESKMGLLLGAARRAQVLSEHIAAALAGAVQEDDERPGRLCYCGKRGCIETWLSGPGIAANFGDGTTATIEIVKRAEAGDAVAEAYIQRVEDRLARALATAINILDPDVIVLGGGVSNIARLYGNVPKLLPKYVFSEFVETRIAQNIHGDSSGVRGAAWLW